MSWWPRRGGQADTGNAGVGSTDTGVRLEVPVQRRPEACDCVVSSVTMERLSAAMTRLEIRYLTDGDDSMLAMWERHAVLFTLEGPGSRPRARSKPPGTCPAGRGIRAPARWCPSRR